LQIKPEEKEDGHPKVEDLLRGEAKIIFKDKGSQIHRR
jgi:hypothetical protein